MDFFSALRVSVRCAIDSIALMMSLLLVVEGADDVLERAEQVAQPVGAAVHHLVELVGDGAELGDAAAAEQERQRAEHLLDLGVAAGVGEVDLVAVGQPAGRRPWVGGLEGDVLLPQQADLADVGDRVVGEVDVVLDPHA